MTYFCSVGSQILYIFETHGIGQTPSSLERYLVFHVTGGGHNGNGPGGLVGGNVRGESRELSGSRASEACLLA